MASNLRRVGALWKGLSKNGGTYYSGKLDAEAMKSALAGDEVRLLLFPVKSKKEKGPDIELFCVPDERRQPEKPSPRQSERPQFDSHEDDEAPW